MKIRHGAFGALEKSQQRSRRDGSLFALGGGTVLERASGQYQVIACRFQEQLRLSGHCKHLETSAFLVVIFDISLRISLLSFICFGWLIQFVNGLSFGYDL